jgi:flavin prenyltransferase
MERPVRLVIGIGGATGAVYGLRLLEVLHAAPSIETHLVLSPEARRTIPAETAYTAEAVEALATRAYDDRDIGAAPASGSFHTRGMIVAPCGPDGLAALATGHAGSLLARAADVTLKERRTLVVVVRETPLHLGHLRRMLLLAEMGAVILPPMPAFYPRPRTVDDLVNHTVGRVLDRVGVPHDLVAEWTGTGRARRTRDQAERR